MRKERGAEPGQKMRNEEEDEKTKTRTAKEVKKEPEQIRGTGMVKPGIPVEQRDGQTQESSDESSGLNIPSPWQE